MISAILPLFLWTYRNMKKNILLTRALLASLSIMLNACSSESVTTETKTPATITITTTLTPSRDSTSPSDNEAKDAILKEVQTLAGQHDNRYIGIEDVEIVEIAGATKHPFSSQLTVWPMRMYLIKDGLKIKCGGWFYKDPFNQWEVDIDYDVQWSFNGDVEKIYRVAIYP